MKTYKVTFYDEIEANTPEEAYAKLVKYLIECAAYNDVDAFSFEELQKKGA